jgi:hypothetical protein
LPSITADALSRCGTNAAVSGLQVAYGSETGFERAVRHVVTTTPARSSAAATRPSARDGLKMGPRRVERMVEDYARQTSTSKRGDAHGRQLLIGSLQRQRRHHRRGAVDQDRRSALLVEQGWSDLGSFN